jgi:hypothetical protein
VTPQKTFGEFTAERFGPYWVYARAGTVSYARNGERQTVITPKEQRQLAADYKAAWGREYDAEFWAMVCALRAAVIGSDETVSVMASEALKAAGVSP